MSGISFKIIRVVKYRNSIRPCIDNCWSWPTDTWEFILLVSLHLYVWKFPLKSFKDPWTTKFLVDLNSTIQDWSHLKNDGIPKMMLQSQHILPCHALTFLEFRVTFSSWITLLSPSLSISFWLLQSHNNQVTDQSNYTWLFCIHRQMKGAGSGGTTVKMDPYKVMSITGRIFVFYQFFICPYSAPDHSQRLPQSTLHFSLQVSTQPHNYTLKRKTFWHICTYMFLHR